MDYWYYTAAIGVTLIPFWIKFRWNVYKKELRGIKSHKLTLEGDALNLHYEYSKYLIELPKLNHLNVNIKKGHIDSIRLLYSDGNNITLTKYEKMNKVLKHLQSVVGEKNTSYHRWFHKH